VAVAEASQSEPRPAAQADRSPATDLKGFTALTGVQILALVASMATAPLVARALGADGRGVLAAIVVPITVAPYLLHLGFGAYAINRVAQGVRPGVVFGSVAIPCLVIGGLVAAFSPLIAGVLSEGRQPIDLYLTIGLALMPISLLLILVTNVAWGLSAWSALAGSRALPALALLFPIVALYLLDELTLESAAIVTLLSGLTSIAAMGSVLRKIGLPRVRPRLIRESVGFSARMSVGAFATTANQRLDQLLMIPLVPARELGLYVVATTIASLSKLFSGQIVTLLVPRVASGDHDLLPQAMRCQFLIVLATDVVIVLGTLVLLVPVFGPDFADARILVLILLVAWIPQAALCVLFPVMPAMGRPGAQSIGELIALGITVPGLILVLPWLGAVGAALVTVVAYTTTFVVVLIVTVRHLGHRWIDYVLPRRSDVAELIRLGRTLTSRFADRFLGAARGAESRR
jgi:O-antigen/teichoic acid export membrane protein